MQEICMILFFKVLFWRRRRKILNLNSALKTFCQWEFTRHKLLSFFKHLKINPTIKYNVTYFPKINLPMLQFNQVQVSAHSYYLMFIFYILYFPHICGLWNAQEKYRHPRKKQGLYLIFSGPITFLVMLDNDITL